MKIAKLITVLSVLAATTAVAQKVQYTATLAQPLNGSREVVANDNLWYCAASTCKLVSQPKNPNSIPSCHALRKKVGALSAYGVPDNSFDAGTLEKCNASG